MEQYLMQLYTHTLTHYIQTGLSPNGFHTGGFCRLSRCVVQPKMEQRSTIAGMMAETRHDNGEWLPAV